MMVLIIVGVIRTNGIPIIVITNIHIHNNNNDNTNKMEIVSLVSLMDETQPSWNR